MKKKILSILLTSAMVLAMMGCGGAKGTSEEDMVSTAAFEATTEAADESTDAEAATVTVNYLTTADYVIEHIDDENVILVDCRGADTAKKGTIKGAIATSWQELCTCDESFGKQGDEGWGKIPAADDLSKRLSDLGLDPAKEIICLGHTLTGWGDDARVAWELIAAGYENVKIVDGGIDAVMAAGAETQKGGSEPTPCEVKVESIDNTHVMETEELQSNYDNYVILDVRTEDEYNGATKYGEAQGGHLPGAIFFPYTELFRVDGTLVSVADIEKMLADNGINKTDNIVTYCTGGIRSAYVQMILEMVGCENTWNYDQSFWRWAVVGDVEK